MSEDSYNTKSKTVWPHKDVLLGTDNWHAWLILYQEELNSHKQLGKDILRNTRSTFRKVNPQDKVDPTDINCTTFRYDHLIEETIDTHVSSQDVKRKELFQNILFRHRGQL